MADKDQYSVMTGELRGMNNNFSEAMNMSNMMAT